MPQIGLFLVWYAYCVCTFSKTDKDMANVNKQFLQFNEDLHITQTKQSKMMNSRENLRSVIRDYFYKYHSSYIPSFYIQGSYKMNTVILTKDDTCDLDDGVYFDSNPDGVSATTLQSWVKNAVSNVTDSTVLHRKKCITVDYKAGYNIDLPVYLFNESEEEHPNLAVKNDGWRSDDPKEMVEAFSAAKRNSPQLLRIVRYLKAWCDYKRQKMPSGLAMTILAMNNHISHDRDDVSLKNTLIQIERSLKSSFECRVPATPYDDIFAEYNPLRRTNFMNNLALFIEDAIKAVDEEKNALVASELWRKHLGDRFPLAPDEDEQKVSKDKITTIIGSSKPYAE